ALAAAPERVRAAVILPCDQPRVTRALLDELVAHYLASDKPIVACAYAGIVGAPALFDRSLFPELERLRGDRGARGILERRPEHVASVPFPDAAFDVDRPADAAALRRDRSKEIE
ncbi:MAG: NTP transferase domain-containing protein, partial [Deltaproteobacteria bacterium]